MVILNLLKIINIIPTFLFYQSYCKYLVVSSKKCEQCPTTLSKYYFFDFFFGQYPICILSSNNQNKGINLTISKFAQYADICPTYMLTYVLCGAMFVRILISWLINSSLCTRTTRNDDKWRATTKRTVNICTQSVHML